MEVLSEEARPQELCKSRDGTESHDEGDSPHDCGFCLCSLIATLCLSGKSQLLTVMAKLVGAYAGHLPECQEERPHKEPMHGLLQKAIQVQRAALPCAVHGGNQKPSMFSSWS